MNHFIIRHEEIVIKKEYQSDFEKLWNDDFSSFEHAIFNKIKDYKNKQLETSYQYYFPLKYWKINEQVSYYRYGVFNYSVEYIKNSSISEFIEFMLHEVFPEISNTNLKSGD